MRRHWVGWSRRWSVVGGGGPSRPPSRKGLSASVSASRMSRTSGTTYSVRWTGSEPLAHAARSFPAVCCSVTLGLGVAGDEGPHHLRCRHAAGDDSLDVLGNGRVDADLLGKSQQRRAGLRSLSDLTRGGDDLLG